MRQTRTDAQESNGSTVVSTVSGGDKVSKSSRTVEKKSSGRVTPVRYYRQVVSELRKVVWPTRQQLTTYFFVVVAFVAFIVTYVALLDLGFGTLVLKVLG